MLEIQYRMDPVIRRFPSTHFYEGRLTDGHSIQTRKNRNWIPKGCELIFFNLIDSKESREVDQTSCINRPEATFVVDMYAAVSPSHGRKLDIGVITPYKRQVHHLRSAFRNRYKNGYKKDVEINTVDGFQGREKDAIIFSCVRSEESIGFLDDMRRLNVAITRARDALWIVGKAETLKRDANWRALIYHAKTEKRYYNVNTQDSSTARQIFDQRHQLAEQTN
jgi:senataxin